jgi:hypothetical protein
MKYTVETLLNLATITLDIEQEDMSPSDVFGEDQGLEKAQADEINDRLNRGDTWAWCVVWVAAEYNGVRVRSHCLGCCSYNDERDFREAGDYFEGMRAEALTELAEQLNGAVKVGGTGETFTLDESRELARLVHKRFGRDLPAATAAWRRLLQNSATETDFKRLVDGQQLR